MIRIGTRASQLAQWQAYWCANQLKNAGIAVEVVLMTTSGDKWLPQNSSLPTLAGGSMGLFTKEIQVALLENRVDLAVHSLKDLPTETTPGLTLAAIPPRGVVEDAIVPGKHFAHDATSLEHLPDGTILGTSSLRRQAQLLALARQYDRKWTIRPIRGNLNTRLQKCDSGEYDVLILARAGVERLGLAHRIAGILPQEVVFPAVGQGALGLETRADDTETIAILQDLLHHPPTAREVLAERTLLQALDGGCTTPIGAYSSEKTLHARVIALDGRTWLDAEGTGDDPILLGQQVAAELKKKGAGSLIQEARTRATVP
ncbi:MAG: hydroxymethylbilane synthase [Planctomycetia bacterium]|nr:hydroxymethylbilane synthase [Planctomycetia bacterium]